MNKLDIEICVCTECVMNGAMDIIESIEELKGMSLELEDEYNTDIEITITPVKFMGETRHSAYSPKVSINGRIFENASSQSIMAEIVAAMKKEVV